MLKAGAWWYELCEDDALFETTPETLEPAQRHLQQAAEAFVADRVLPRMEALESPDFVLHRAILDEAGALGFLGLLVPETYGGSEQGLLTAALVLERFATGGAVGVSTMAHSGIGTLPLVLFGNADQRARYLPDLAMGQWISAFALTEPEAGSDVMAMRTTANRCAGGWRINGRKQFISNAGMADLYTVFARTGDRSVTAFLMERTFSGVSLGSEERKMGMNGSSTRRLAFDDVFVPDGNVLGKVGRGHAVAFTVLHFTRFLMAAGCLGLARRSLSLASDYAGSRSQFGRPIATMGLVREKLAGMATRIYGLESALHRLGGWLDRAGRDRSTYAAECSALKVFASETTGYCADEAVQIHGGYGYMRGCEVERLYRDVRVQRIFEGTNEINRLIVARRMVRTAKRLPPRPADGQVGAAPAWDRTAFATADGRHTGNGLGTHRGARPGAAAGGLPDPDATVQAVKRVALELASTVGGRSSAPDEAEEVLGRVADAAIAAFVADSARERTRREPSPERCDLAALVAHWARETTLHSAREVFGALLPPDEAMRAYMERQALIPQAAVDPIATRARVAERLVGPSGPAEADGALSQAGLPGQA